MLSQVTSSKNEVKRTQQVSKSQNMVEVITNPKIAAAYGGEKALE